ncbi:uncharacterized protein PITG_03580 [Phytophthora infestans T30-4]|uniref:ZSWIM1/3 RNaseH-like domain-containing protein n=1 Tax=Phytophthora infestans (strain T30-4) TaxID=403677 RepID=D0MXZ2_PHYIT|nr:uncharacterized protein PITG_03580 [Phytophthora infestans T30-4]EEY66040.1 hypothetical protein PITG_03580 [Phytophthora infestans T30-4]|eukprot:XP_002906639.1 hypothetical protein PITG_03580 [Phytophthora infestans T30-4]
MKDEAGISLKSSSDTSQRSGSSDNEDEGSSEVASTGSLKREHAECDDGLYCVQPLRKYHKNGGDLFVSFELEAPGNVTTEDEDGEGHSAVVTISSQHMWKLYKRFSEILLVDCTHKTSMSA